MKRNILTGFGTDSKEFKHYVGREPNSTEFNQWVHLLENGANAQLDWGMIAQCASEHFKKK